MIFGKSRRQKQISLLIDAEIYEEVKKNHWHHAEIYLHGFRYYKNTTPFHKSVADLEKRNEELKRNINNLSVRLAELEILSSTGNLQRKIEAKL